MTCQPETNTVATTPATSTPENIVMTQHTTSQTGSTSIPNFTFGAATAMICNAIAAAADQINEALRDTGLNTERALETLAGKVDELRGAIETAGDSAEWAGRHAKDGLSAISVSLDFIARDIRGTTAEVIYARVDEALRQQRMVANLAPRRTAKPCRNRGEAK